MLERLGDMPRKLSIVVESDYGRGLLDSLG